MLGIVELIFKSLLGLTKPKTFRDRMNEFTNLLFKYGPDSLVVDSYIQRYRNDKQFVKLAVFSVDLKRDMDAVNSEK